MSAYSLSRPEEVGDLAWVSRIWAIGKEVTWIVLAGEEGTWLPQAGEKVRR